MKVRRDDLQFVHPWSPYEGVISSVCLNDKKGCLIFYVPELSLQLDGAEGTVFILIETLNGKDTRPELRRIDS